MCLRQFAEISDSFYSFANRAVEPAGEIQSVFLRAEMVFLYRKMTQVNLEVSSARYAFWISGAKCCIG
jgi:hypothetical protein